MLKIENITFSYPRQRVPVLSDISLSILPGGVYGLLGKNGVGKSTLLYLIAGLLTPSHGEITLYGANTRRRAAKTLADIFIVPEELDLPAISIDKYVKLNSKFYPKFSHEDLKRNLELFNLPNDINLGRLSMGQKKKAFMSFALAANTPLLLMDEPTNGLDIPSKASFRSFIASGMNDDRAIIISTHQVRDINLLLDHIIIMEKNKVILNRSVSDITTRLCFELTDNPETIARAIFSQATIQGTNVITRNDGTKETPVDLETLFELSINNPILIDTIFNDNPNTKAALQ